MSANLVIYDNLVKILQLWYNWAAGPVAVPILAPLAYLFAMRAKKLIEEARAAVWFIEPMFADPVAQLAIGTCEPKLNRCHHLELFAPLAKRAAGF